uniref:Uncharacterized protein n=1 Tax=Oreochromis aureus TaxID=47969 RepID=A0A668SHK7_OREAU
MGIIKVRLHHALSPNHSMTRANATEVTATIAKQMFRPLADPFVNYLNITSPENVVQVETGYIDKNTWLDLITYTARVNNMTDCVACSAAHPTLFTVPAPLLFSEDRPGFDCMLQLHMTERVDHDCAVLSTPFPVVRKSVTPPRVLPKGRKLYVPNQGKCHPRRSS